MADLFDNISILGDKMTTKLNGKIAVVGGGSAGIMAALRGVLNNDEVLLYMGSAKTKKKSRALWVSKIENIPGHFDYKKGIVNPNIETLKWIKQSEFKDNLIQINSAVTDIKKNSDGTFNITDDKGATENVFAVVLATGVMDVQPKIQGSIETVFPFANVQLIDYCIRCDGHHVQNKNVAIIGGGDGAAWVGILLKERYDIPEITIVTNGDEQEFTKDTKKLIELYKIKVENSPILNIQGDAKQRKLDGFKLEDGKDINAKIAFVSMGMVIYNELAKQIGAQLDERGFVKTFKLSETSMENAYAIGDLKANSKKQIYTGWDNAVDAMDSINSKLRRIKRNQMLEAL